VDELFFLVSKLAWGLLSPSHIIVFLLVLSALLLLMNKIRQAKFILLPTVLISVLVLLYPVGDLLISPLESRFSKPSSLPDNIDGIIILGGGEELRLSLDWQVAEIGNGGDRYLAAAILARHYPALPIIFSGGSGHLNFSKPLREGDIFYQLLTAIGIEEHRLIIESSSRNTHENFVYLKSHLPAQSGHYLLVTSAFHMPRAIGVARQQGINVIAYPVDYRGNTEEFRQWGFDFFGHLQALEPAWREWIGLMTYYWTGKIGHWFPRP